MLTANTNGNTDDGTQTVKFRDDVERARGQIFLSACTVLALMPKTDWRAAPNSPELHLKHQHLTTRRLYCCHSARCLNVTRRIRPPPLLSALTLFHLHTGFYVFITRHMSYTTSNDDLNICKCDVPRVTPGRKRVHMHIASPSKLGTFDNSNADVGPCANKRKKEQ